MSLCLGFGTAKGPGSNLEGGGEHARGTIYQTPHREETTQRAGARGRGGLRSLPGRSKLGQGWAKGAGEARGADAGETHTGGARASERPEKGGWNLT